MKRAFTLIEIMICIAVLAILFVTEAAHLMVFRHLRDEGREARALSQARQQLAVLHRMSFAKLPPFVGAVGRGGWTRLGPRDLLPGSISAIQLGKGALTPEEVDAPAGTVRLPGAAVGQPLLVDYEFYLPQRNEVHRISGDVVELEDSPVHRVSGVWLGQGDRCLPLTGWRLEAPNRLRLPAAVRTGVVVVDYRGDQEAVVVSGSFVDESLRPSSAPTPFKLIRLHSPERHWELSLLKVNS